MKSRNGLTRRVWIALVVATIAGGMSLAARAQPSVVKFILPNATGSGVDAITRAAQPALAKALNAAVVVENQPGAGGVVGLQALARAAPDGSTLSVVSNNVVIFPSVLKSLPFDMPGDFTPIAVVGTTPMVLVVNPGRIPVSGSREFIAHLKSRPGEVNYGSGGNGTILHLATELVLEAAGASAKHIPYKGVGPMVADLLGGQIDFATAALPSVQGQIRGGSLRAIGLLAPQRSSAAPDILTFAEQGLTNFSVEAWFAVIGPKNMNPATVKRAHDAVVAAFKDPTVMETMAKQGNTINVSTPEQAHSAFQTELAKYAALVKKVGLQAQ